jgi:pfkB family carbohydrate kinase
VSTETSVLSVLGELVVDLIPVPEASAGPQGTAPHYVARPGGNALNVAVAAGRRGTPVRLLARLGSEELPDDQLLPIVDDAALVAAMNCTPVGADPPTREELTAARR